MSAPLNARSKYVFGVVTRGDEKNLVFIPESEATRLAAVYDAIFTSKTWSDFTKQMPADDLREVVSRFIDDEPAATERQRQVRGRVSTACVFRWRLAGLGRAENAPVGASSNSSAIRNDDADRH